MYRFIHLRLYIAAIAHNSSITGHFMTIPYLFPWDTVLSPLAMDVGQPDSPGFRKGKETHRREQKNSPSTSVWEGEWWPHLRWRRSIIEIDLFFGGGRDRYSTKVSRISLLKEDVTSQQWIQHCACHGGSLFQAEQNINNHLPSREHQLYVSFQEGIFNVPNYAQFLLASHILFPTSLRINEEFPWESRLLS